MTIGVCEWCSQPMKPPVSCSVTSIIFAGVWFDRIPFGSERYYYEDIQCHDCGVTVGQIHHGNCDVEECSICGEQFLSCDCDTEYEKAATITGHNANVYKAIDKNDRPAVLACRIKKLMGSGTIEMQHARMYKNKGRA